MRLEATRSKPPLGAVEGQELDLLGLEVENRAGRRPVNPSARFARIDDQRLAPRPGFLLVRAAVDDQAVRLHRPGLYFADVVHEEHSLAADLEGVRRLEELDAQPGCRPAEQPLPVAVVASEDAAHGQVWTEQRCDGKRRTEVACMQ